MNYFWYNIKKNENEIFIKRVLFYNLLLDFYFILSAYPIVHLKLSTIRSTIWL